MLRRRSASTAATASGRAAHPRCPAVTGRGRLDVDPERRSAANRADATKRRSAANGRWPQPERERDGIIDRGYEGCGAPRSALQSLSERRCGSPRRPPRLRPSLQRTLDPPAPSTPHPVPGPPAIPRTGRTGRLNTTRILSKEPDPLHAFTSSRFEHARRKRRGDGRWRASLRRLLALLACHAALGLWSLLLRSILLRSLLLSVTRRSWSPGRRCAHAPTELRFERQQHRVGRQRPPGRVALRGMVGAPILREAPCGSVRSASSISAPDYGTAGSREQDLGTLTHQWSSPSPHSRSSTDSGR